jgi:DNA-binding transcriptional LysR family regulator
MRDIQELEVFARVAQQQSLSAAARQLGLTPSAVSRLVARLERRLGVSLLHRTTRGITLTDEGTLLSARATQILADIASAEVEVTRAGKDPVGRIRLDAPHVLGEFVLGPALPAFLHAHPGLVIELSLHDRFIDPRAEGIDVVLRMARHLDTDLVARPLGAVGLVTAAAPSYLRAHGRPQTPADLHAHSCLSYIVHGRPMTWSYQGPDGRVSLPVTGRMHASSGAALLAAAVSGLGLVHLFVPYLAASLRAGTLVQVLAEHELPPVPVAALYASRGVPLRLRVLLDFLAGLFGRG